MAQQFHNNAELEKALEDVIASSKMIEGLNRPTPGCYALDMIGDSMVARQNQIYALDNTYTGDVTNGVLTLTSPSTTWSMHAGNKFYLMNVTPDSAVTLYTCIAGTTSLTVKATCDLPIPDCVLDFSTITNTSGPFMVRIWRSADTSVATHAAAYSNGAIEKGYCMGFNSRPSYYLPAKIHDFLDWIPNKNRRILVHWMGINDIGIFGSNGSGTFANIKINLDILKTLGYAKIIVNTIGPVDTTTYSGWNTTMRNNINYCNMLIKQYVSQNPEFILNDNCSYNMSTATTCTAVANTLEDQVHLSALGAERAGKGLWDNILSKLGLPVVKKTPSTAMEAFTNISAQIFNGIYNMDATTGALASGGSLAGGATGTVKSSFTLTNLSSTAVAGTMPARSGIEGGYDQQIDWTSSAAGQGWSWGFTTPVTSRITADKRLRCFLEVTFSGCTNVKSLHPNLTVTYGGLSTGLCCTVPTTTTKAMENGDRTVLYEFGHIGYITPGTCDFTFLVTLVMGAAGGGTIKLSAPVCYLESV